MGNPAQSKNFEVERGGMPREKRTM